MIKKLIFVLGIVFLFSFVSANGCCFYTTDGMCSKNVQQNVCLEGGGQWSGDAMCTRSECATGCCVLGSSTLFSTERTCEVQSLSRGFEKDWRRGVSDAACTAMSGGTDMGACVYEGPYENQCGFVARSQCPPDKFNQGVLCSDSSLNTICEKTDTKRCFEDGHIYYLDSCGNRDALVKECNYAEGFLCEQKSSKVAECRNLNCANGKKNGESWCIGLDGKEMNYDLRGIANIDPKEYPGALNDDVGSRFFRQVCIDGEVVTEPCGDYRSEVCIPDGEGNAQCIANQGDLCYEANLEEPKLGSGYGGDNWKLDGSGGTFQSYSYVDSEACDSEWCFEFRALDCVRNPDTGGSLCGAERWKRGTHEEFATNVIEHASPLLADLSLNRCVPKVKLGHDISSSGFGSDSGGYCSMADFSANTWLDHDKGSRDRWSVISKSEYGVEVQIDQGKYGNAGIISLFLRDTNSPESDWHWYVREDRNHRFDLCEKEKNPLFHKDLCNVRRKGCFCQTVEYFSENIQYFRSQVSKGEIPDSTLIYLLNERTKIGFGDCAGSVNWVGQGGSSSNSVNSEPKRGTSGRNDHILFSMLYEAKSFRPPASGDCNLCGSDGLPCSKYRCNALGRSCEYKEPRGIDTGICYSTTDMSPPSISHDLEHDGGGKDNPIPPFSHVKITLTTNKESYCKFDFSSKGGKIEDMQYETSSKFLREHEFVLNVPGRARYDDDFPELPLLTRDGKYELFVRCEGANGFANINPYIVNLEVMDTPDENPPVILRFDPPTNSPIEANTTSKLIRFELNEPAECRWDFEDKSYEDMGAIVSLIDPEDEEIDSYNANQFICDETITNDTMINGYWCSGILPNVTTTIGESTKYYIRCKDQPYLEDHNPDPNYYSRNTNPTSREYVLRPSLPLEISSVSPVGDRIVGSNIGNLTYQVITAGGAGNGRAECRWRLKIGNQSLGWQVFEKTNSSSHEATLTTLTSAQYFVEVSCVDIAGNKAEKTSELNILIDTTPPSITRIYNDRGNIKIALNEPASCNFVTNLGCHMVHANGTSMNVLSGRKEFTTNLIKNTPYYITCTDDFGNSRCFGDIVFS
jgi:hypothetical protein